MLQVHSLHSLTMHILVITLVRTRQRQESYMHLCSTKKIEQLDTALSSLMSTGSDVHVQLDNVTTPISPAHLPQHS